MNAARRGSGCFILPSQTRFLSVRNPGSAENVPPAESMAGVGGADGIRMGARRGHNFVGLLLDRTATYYTGV